jgi:hypothetical protein
MALRLDFEGTPLIIEHMPRKDAKTKLTKEVKTIYLSKEVGRRLKKVAAEEGMSQSVYIEQTLRARFKKDGIE